VMDRKEIRMVRIARKEDLSVKKKKKKKKKKRERERQREREREYRQRCVLGECAWFFSLHANIRTRR